MHDGVFRFYKIRAVNVAGESDLSLTPEIGYSGLPAMPTNVQATGDSTSQIKLTWNTVLGATQYKVYTSPPRAKFNLAGTVNSAAFADNTGLSAGMLRYYRIAAVNPVGEGSRSNTVTGTTLK